MLSQEQYAAYLERKKAAIIDFTIKKDSKGNILNPEVVSVAVQDKRDTCDVNRIMKRVEEAKKKGEMYIPPTMRTPAGTPGGFSDFTNAKDYEGSLNSVIKMNELFMTLPPDVRFKFANDPVKLVEELDKAKADPKVKEELIGMGILPKPKYETKKVETPEGNFWVKYKDNVEIGRTKIEAPIPSA